MAQHIELIEFDSRAGMAEQVADKIESQLAGAITERGAASLAVSGGSTPAGLYSALSKRVLEWSKISAALVDERWTPPDTAGSNETFIRDTLIQNEARAASFEGMWRDAPSPHTAQEDVEACYAKLPHPFDVIVLGMGADGHTASWFPRAEGLDGALDDGGKLVAAVTALVSKSVGAHRERMTLTLGAMTAARFICVLLAGDEKRSVFLEACEDGTAYDMPIRAIMRKRPDLWVCWAP